MTLNKAVFAAPNLDLPQSNVSFERDLILGFTADTDITTPRGPIKISKLRAGDQVITKDDGPQTIRWIGGKKVSPLRLKLCPQLTPVRLKTGCIAPNVPSHDLTVSPQHRMLFSDSKAKQHYGEDEIFVPAKALLNDSTVSLDQSGKGVYYVHIMFDKHQIIYANDTETESLHPGHLGKDALDAQARDELFAIFTKLRATPESYGQAARPTLRVRESQPLVSDIPTLSA